MVLAAKPKDLSSIHKVEGQLFSGLNTSPVACSSWNEGMKERMNAIKRFLKSDEPRSDS